MCVVALVLKASGNLRGYKWSGHNPLYGCFPHTSMDTSWGFGFFARYSFVQNSAQSASPAQSSCCPSLLLPDAGDNGRSKIVPQTGFCDGVVWCEKWIKWKWGSSELRKMRSVLFWGNCKGLLVYARTVKVCILGGCKVICECSLSIDSTWFFLPLFNELETQKLVLS